MIKTEQEKYMRKKGFKKIAAFLCMLLFGICLTGTALGVSAEGEKKEINIVFTHDLHSHLDGFLAQIDGQEQEVGGFARIKTFVDAVRAEEVPSLVLDGGDFSMGTLYQAVYETQAAELRMLGFLGTDVTTMGNHEFDYRTKGLDHMLRSAMDSQDPLPAFALCNVDWEASLAQGIPEVESLKEAFEEYGISPYIMVDKGDLKIAVVGVFGKDALECAPTCELIFKDPAEAVKETVEEIRKQESPDLIVCVSHSGTWEEEKKSEDEILAKAVPELDLIISGHTHSVLEEPIVHGNTVIVSTGEYGMRVGKIRMSQTKEGRWAVEDYQLEQMTEEVEENPEALSKIESLGTTIDADYLAGFGYTKEQVLAYNPWKNPTLQEISDVLGENAYTNLLADAYRDTLNRLPDMEQDPVDVAVVPSGVIRDVFAENSDITVSDVFNAFSLGIGPDGVPGYPLVSIYLTGEELRTAAEVDASISPMMTTAQLFMSGLNYTLNPNRLILNKVTEISLCDMDGSVTELEDDKLYRVVADLYSGQMLGAVTDQSYGILSITPKDENGNPVEDLEDHIVYENGREIKAWEAIARYVERMGEENGEISEYYSQTHNRKVIEDDSSIGALVKSPNKIAFALVGIVLAVILILVLLVVVIVKLVKRRKRRK